MTLSLLSFFKHFNLSKKSSSYCVLPFTHIEVRPEGKFSPCCHSRNVVLKNSEEAFNIKSDDIKTVFNSRWMKNLRKDLSNGVKNENCIQCWHDEKMGVESRRLRENRISKKSFFTEKFPSHLDLKLGNLCNLKCRICGPRSSSSWASEYNKENGSIKYEIFNPNNDSTYFWTDLSKNLNKVKHFEIFGGEPFLIRKQFEILSKSIKLGYSNDQTIHYNTNGTIYPEFEIKNIFPHFKHVRIGLSIDDTGERFEYQRYPAKWKEVKENVSKFKNNFKGSLLIYPTISNYNIYYLDDILNDLDVFEIPILLNKVYFPRLLNFEFLPFHLRLQIFNKIKNINSKNVNQQSLKKITNYLLANESLVLLDKFISYTEIMDKKRNQNFSKVFSEFNNLIVQPGNSNNVS